MTGRPPTLYRFGGFEASERTRTLRADGRDLPIGRKAVAVLLVLLERAGEVVERAELMRRVWPDVVVEENNLDQCLSALRRALGDPAGAPRWLETVHRRGVRFRGGPVERVPDVAGGDPPAGSAGGAPTPGRGVSATRALAILPFLDAADADAAGGEAGLGAALADALIARCTAWQAAGVAVRSSGAVARFAQADRDPVAAGRDLDADFVVAGRLRRRQDRLRLSVELIAVADATAVWADRFDEPVGDLFLLEDRLCARVFDAMARQWPVVARPLAAAGGRPTRDVEAYQLFFQGRHFANQLTAESFERSRHCFEKAIALDPGFALAHAGLAYLFINAVDIYLPPVAALPAARDAARRALAIDADLPEALACLGCVAFWYDRDVKAAEEHFRRAVDGGPDLSFPRLLRGWFLALCGRGEEAMVDIERAVEIDPYSIEPHLYLAAALYFLRRFEEAERAARQAVRDTPDLWLNHVMLARCREARGALDEAVEPLERALVLDPDNPEALADLGRVVARRGDRGRALEILARLAAPSARRGGRPAPSFCCALVWVGLGEAERACDEIERAIEERSWMVSWMAGASVLDPLRPLPRFAALRRRAGF